MQNLSNTTYTIKENEITFSFRFNAEWHSAVLELPDIAKSIHRIDDLERKAYIEHGESKEKEGEWGIIIDLLKKEYYSDFKNEECAAASAVLGDRVYHVEQILGIGKNDHVAFLADKSVVLRLGDDLSYCNTVYFEVPKSNEHLGDEAAAIKAAKKTFFKTLSESLREKIQKTWESINFDNLEEDYDLWKQGFDDDVGAFMNDEFGDDWEKIALAQDFYEAHGCDVRGDFDYELTQRRYNAE